VSGQKMSGTNCDVSVGDLQRDLEAKKRNLDNVLLDNQRKQDRLAKLEALIKERKKSITDKNTAIVATERKIRDGNVVNNRMIDQIKLKTDQLRLLQEEQTAIEQCSEAEKDNQCQLVEDQAKFLLMVAEFMTAGTGAGGDVIAPGGQITQIVRDLEARLAQLERAVTKQLAGRTQNQIQAEIDRELLKLEHYDKELAEIQEKLSMLGTQPTAQDTDPSENDNEGVGTDNGRNDGERMEVQDDSNNNDGAAHEKNSDGM